VEDLEVTEIIIFLLPHVQLTWRIAYENHVIARTVSVPCRKQTERTNFEKILHKTVNNWLSFEKSIILYNLLKGVGFFNWEDNESDKRETYF